MKSVKILIVQHLKPVLCCSGPNLVELDSAGAKSSSTWFGRGQIKFNLIWTRTESSRTVKTGFFRVCISFLPCFLLCHGQNIHRKDILKKKMNPVCFLLRQESPIQKSATPQGLPPPTQQIKIQMQTSWVGRSTSGIRDIPSRKVLGIETNTPTNHDWSILWCLGSFELFSSCFLQKKTLVLDNQRRLLMKYVFCELILTSKRSLGPRVQWNPEGHVKRIKNNVQWLKKTPKKGASKRSFFYLNGDSTPDDPARVHQNELAMTIN